MAVQRPMPRAPEIHGSSDPDYGEFFPRHSHLKVAVMPNWERRGHLWALINTSCNCCFSLKVFHPRPRRNIAKLFHIRLAQSTVHTIACVHAEAIVAETPKLPAQKYRQTDRQAACYHATWLTAVALSAHDSLWAGWHRQTDRQTDRQMCV